MTAAALAVAGAILGAAPAGAHQLPAGCGGNFLEVLVERVGGPVVRNGETLIYEVTVANDQPRACLVTGVTITLTLPARNGTPTGRVETLVTGATYEAGATPVVLGRIPWTVDVEPGVVDAVARASASGPAGLHDAGTDHDVLIDRTVGTDVSQPHVTLTATAAPTTGRAPLTVGYTYTLTNTSLTPVPLTGVTVSDDRCASATLAGGDANGNALFDNGEVWTYTCAHTFTTGGAFPGTVTASAVSTVDGRPVPIASATTSVTVARPLRGAGAPDGDDTPTRAEILRRRLPAVGSRRARGDARCISTPTSLRVRARELTRVRVRVREDGRPVPRALVRITGPGLERRAVTNARGIVTVKVRPRRSGRLVIQSDHCSGADRVRVRAARQVVSGRVPRNTG